MRPDPRDAGYLLDMLEAGRKIQRYLEGKTYSDYQGDELLRDGVERNLEIMGEAARRISEPLKQAHPEIPWRKMIAQRNVIVHEYDDLFPLEIWEVGTLRIPELLILIERLLPALPEKVEE